MIIKSIEEDCIVFIDDDGEESVLMGGMVTEWNGEIYIGYKMDLMLGKIEVA